MIFFYLYISPYIITHFSDFVNRFFCLTEKNCGNFLLTKAFGRERSLIRVCSSKFTAHIRFGSSNNSPLAFFLFIYIPIYYNTFLGLCQDIFYTLSTFFKLYKTGLVVRPLEAHVHLGLCSSKIPRIIELRQQQIQLVLLIYRYFFIYIYIPLYYNTFCAPLQWNKLLNNIKIAAIILIAQFVLRLQSAQF